MGGGTALLPLLVQPTWGHTSRKMHLALEKPAVLVSQFTKEQGEGRDDAYRRGWCGARHDLQ